jgi:hypothetical protein
MQRLQGRLLPLVALYEHNAFPSKAEALENAFVYVDDRFVLPITGWIIGARLKKVVTDVNAQGLQGACKNTGAISMHAQHHDRA